MSAFRLLELSPKEKSLSRRKISTDNVFKFSKLVSPRLDYVNYSWITLTFLLHTIEKYDISLPRRCHCRVFLPYGNVVLAVRREEHSDRGLLNVQGACLLGDPAHRNILSHSSYFLIRKHFGGHNWVPSGTTPFLGTTMIPSRIQKLSAS